MRVCGREDVEIDAEHVIPLWLSVPVLEQMNAPQMQSERGNDVLYRSMRMTSGALLIGSFDAEYGVISAWLVLCELRGLRGCFVGGATEGGALS